MQAGPSRGNVRNAAQVCARRGRSYLRPRSAGKYAGHSLRAPAEPAFRPRREAAPRVSFAIAAPVEPALTDTDTTARPAPTENHLLINAYTTHPRSPLLAVSRRIADSGCNLVDTRLSTVGRDVSVTALATGSWDAVAKLEAMLSRLEREEDLKLVWYRTGPKPIQSNLLPYIVEVVASDKPGILFQLADFFDHQNITIESLHCSRYRAMQTGADMFSAQITIGVPADMHIAALRDDFLEFCDHLNLDAIMDPMKF
ncbi:glycine cleavage system protein R [Luteimonas sp. MC1782]|nr:glycine cleavage system protein R [Luteimonas sp. MC1782]